MRIILLLVFFGNIFLVNAQKKERIRDSIFKYQFQNPNLAIEFGLEYFELREGDPPDLEMVKTYAKVGEILSYMELYASSLEYFNRALQIKNSIKVDSNDSYQMEDPPWILLNIGNIYFQNRKYDKAEQKYIEAKNSFQKLKSTDPNDSNNGINTSNSNLALISEVRGDHDSAEKIYYQVYENRLTKGKGEDIMYSLAELMAVKIRKNELAAAKNKLQEIVEFYQKEKVNDPQLETSLLTRNYGYAFLGMGSYYQSIKEYSNAIEKLNLAKEILKAFPVEKNLLGSRLAECYLGMNDLKKAEDIALDNLKFKNLSDKEKRYNYRVLEKVYQKEQNKEGLLKIKDSLILIASGVTNSRILKNFNDLETQMLLSNSARELNESKIRYNTYLFVLIIGSVILFFSLITIRINYNYQKEKGSRLELEKEKVLAELDQKNRELVSKANFIIQRNDYLKNLQKKITTTQEQEDYSSVMVSKELDKVINSEKSYDEFDKMFVNVYPDFYNKLNQISKLSQTDLRLASYIKMNRNNNEIADISGISLRTVESQRYRLTKKLNLENQDLNSFLISL